MINFVVAMGKNNVIGKDNSLPWRLPEDLKYFKKITLNHTMVMGRKTFQSLPGILPERKHVVLTKSDLIVRSPMVEMSSSIEEVLEKYKDENICVIGGAEIFKQFMPYVSRMFITYIDEEFEGDTYFPEINDNEWKELHSEKGIKNEKNPYDYYFKIYEKKRS